MECYQGTIWSSAGSQVVELELDDSLARIAVRSRWMGQPHRRFVLTGTIEVASLAVGRIRVDRLEVGEGDDDAPLRQVPVPTAEEIAGEPLPDDPVAPRFIVLEFARVPRTPLRLHPELAQAGCGSHPEFDLLLWVDPHEGRPGIEPLASLYPLIDKVKLRRAD